MKAVVFHDIGDIRVDDVDEPVLDAPTDAIVRLTASAICGTDLHFVRGTLSGMRRGTVLGHEGVGVVEELGADVRNLQPGDRVVIGSTIACGSCVYCRAGYYSQCDSANPHGPHEGTAFFGGPASSGPFNGLQAEHARVPFAHTNCVKLPDEVSDDQAILISDIFPTGYFGATLAEITPGDTVAVFGCGPVGQFVIASAKLLGAGRVFAIDAVPSRLDVARAQGAETINFDHDDPVETLRHLTGGIGPDRAVDAVGVDAVMPHKGPAKPSDSQRREFKDEQKEVAPKSHPRGDLWRPGDAPSQVLLWAVEALAKAGTLAIVGVYSEAAKSFPIGDAIEKNLTIKMGNCPHRKFIPKLVELVRIGAIDPAELLSQRAPLISAIEAYESFDRREAGWMKVMLEPQPLHASHAL
jgi:threonine dehydrogenase-like Zn-dependent dehydrogenase